MYGDAITVNNFYKKNHFVVHCVQCTLCNSYFKSENVCVCVSDQKIDEMKQPKDDNEPTENNKTTKKKKNKKKMKTILNAHTYENVSKSITFFTAIHMNA